MKKTGLLEAVEERVRAIDDAQTAAWEHPSDGRWKGPKYIPGKAALKTQAVRTTSSWVRV
ncbi:hypothetical protein GCM10010254_11160 [Streptomyces chromofuscus]|nr:hypothetical protein GCM10010254_11160 [Streptomyces chromofuscus]